MEFSQHWFESPTARRVLAREWRLAAQIAPELTGQRCLWVGPVPPPLGLLPRSMRVVHCAPYGRTLLEHQRLPQFVSAAESLPVTTGEFDCVILHHALEFSHHPHAVVRESWRATSYGGKLLVLGFNPLSGFGLRQMFRPLQSAGRLCQPIHSLRVRDWLSLLGFDVGATRYFRAQQRIDRGWFSTSYGILAAKSASGARLIRPQWQPRRPQSVVQLPVSIGRQQSRSRHPDQPQ